MSIGQLADPEGAPTRQSVDEYECRARGGAAAVTVTGVFADGAGPGIDRLDFVSEGLSFYHKQALTGLGQAIRCHGAVASVELSHPGAAEYPTAGNAPIGPSACVRGDGAPVLEMTYADMKNVAAEFAKAAASAKAAGFQMVTIDGAHGWLLAQTLSPLTNHRADRFGGTLENRARFALMVLRAVREAVGDHFLIEYRLSGSERTEGGLTIDDSVNFCRMIEDEVDLLHVSSGLYHDPVRTRALSCPMHPHGCNLELAAAVKKAVRIPVVAVGGFNDPGQIEEALTAGMCDFVALGRQMLADPDFVKKTAEGREDEIAPCLRCDCLPARAGGERAWPEPFRCPVNPLLTLHTRKAPVVRRPQKILVIGGGPAGMYAAITAARRGHSVRLAEREKTLGGRLWFTDEDCHKEDLRRFRDSLIARVRAVDVDVVTGLAVGPDIIEKTGPDAVIIAIGSESAMPPIPGLAVFGRHVLWAYRHPEAVGKRVVMIGAGLAGLECAMHLADKYGCEVTVLNKDPDTAQNALQGHRLVMELFMPGAVSVKYGVRVTEVRPKGVSYRSRNGRQVELAADTVLYAVGMRPKTAEATELSRVHPNTRLIGDCRSAGCVADAVRDGFFAAGDIG